MHPSLQRCTRSVGKPMTSDWLRRFVDACTQDLRYGARLLRQSPLATAVMIASIALGIGVTTAVFTLADVMLLRPLPYPNADRLVVPFQTVTSPSGARRDTLPWTFARYNVLRDATRAFDDIGFASWVDGLLRTPDGYDTPLRIEAITGSMLTTFAIAAQAGRVFQGDED